MLVVDVESGGRSKEDSDPFILTLSTINTTCCNSTDVPATAFFQVLSLTLTHSPNLKSTWAGIITGGAYTLPGSRNAECLIAFRM
jgi:hypothetical protein